MVYLEHQIYLAQMDADERAERSPFDPTSKSTFIGSIVAKVIPYAGNLATVSGFVTTMGTLVKKAAMAIMPTTHAASLVGFSESLEVCKDQAYIEAGVATDPFCNVIYGLPMEYVDMSPSEVLQELVDLGEITIAENGRPVVLDYYFGNATKGMTGLKKYETQCVQRSKSIASYDEVEGDGSNCTTAGSGDRYKKILYALFFIDNRIMDNISGDGMSIVNNSKGTSSGIPADDGCSDTKDCAGKIMKLYDEGRIVALENSTWPEYMRRVAESGERQPSVCYGNSALNNELMTIDVTLASTMIRLASRYSVTVRGFGFMGDEGIGCDGGYHPKGQAIDIVRIEDETKDTGMINYAAGQVETVSNYTRDFVEAVRSSEPNATVHVGQTSCSAVFNSYVKFPNAYKAAGNSCDHLYLAVTR